MVVIFKKYHPHVNFPLYSQHIPITVGRIRIQTHYKSHYHLVGGFDPSEKYEFVSWDD